MTAPKTIISISGALKRDDCPAWIPHDNHATEAQAIDAIIAHMSCDALRPQMMDKKTGPVNWSDRDSCWQANGNFFLCSAGFEICPLSDAGRFRLLAAWYTHRDSRQYQLVQELEAVGDELKAKENAQASQRGIDSYRSELRSRDIRAPFLLRIRPLELELESIYKSNRVSEK